MTQVFAIDISQDFAPARKFDNIGSIVNLFVSNMFILAGLILFIGIILGGFKVMTSGGDPDKLGSGKKTLTYSAIGFGIIMVSYFLVKVVFKIIGVDNSIL